MTFDPLLPQDQDGDGIDVYERSGGVTTLVTQDSLPNGYCTDSSGSTGPCDMVLLAVSDDGAHVFFSTYGALVPEDDSGPDIYERFAGQTRLVTTSNVPTPQSLGQSLEGISADGTKAFFATPEPFSASDTDTCNFYVGNRCTDLYMRAGGTTTLVSTGPTASNASTPVGSIDVTPDGAHAFFLIGADTDGGQTDLYDYDGSGVSLVSTGPTAGGPGAVQAWHWFTSEDGSHVAFPTTERLTAADTDSALDVYERTGGTTSLVSTGPVGGNAEMNARLDRISQDGSHIFFLTTEQLTPDDTDSLLDIYDRSGGQTRLVSTGPELGASCVNPPDQPFLCDPYFLNASHDGSVGFFISRDQLVAQDTDNRADIYARHDGTTTLISAGQAGGGTYDYSTWVSIPESGARIYFQGDERLAAGDTDSAQDVYRARLPTGYARPKGATPVFASLVPAYADCPTPNRQHGPPLAFGSCAPPQRASSRLTVGTPDANGRPAKSIGSVSLYVIVGDPATPADEADVAIATDITDVRLASDLSDYTGNVQARIGLRATDRAGADPQTLTNTSIQVPVSCAATADTTIGARCTNTTTADALVPGIAPERARSIWALDQISVLDGDGAPFAVQGLFVP